MRELYERDASVETIEVVCLCFIIIVAFTGNVSVWIIVCRSRELRTITNIFILVLSAADLLVSIVNMPLTVSAVVSGDSPLSETSCTVFGYVNMLFLVTSVLSLCNISINRYVMVCRPHRFQAIYTRRNAAFMIVGVVSLAACLSLPPLFGWGTYAYVPEHSSCFCDWTNSVSYAVFMITCCFGGPFGVMTVCNVFIYRTVRASRHRLRKISMTGCPTVELNVSATGVVSVPRDESSTDAETSTDMCKEVRFEDVETMVDTCKDVTLRKSRSPSTEVILKRRSFFEKQAQKKEHRLAMSLIVVVITFVICWLPYCISMLFTIFLPGDVPKGFHMFTITFGYANSCCNPIIYGAMNLQFRKGFQKLYCCCRNT